jgi:hypothetical protein
LLTVNKVAVDAAVTEAAVEDVAALWELRVARRPLS